MKKLAFNESEQTEFKDCRGVKRAKLPDDLWQSIAAFSNSHGGKIFLGIEDNGAIVNLSTVNIDKLQKDLSTLLSNDFFNSKPKVAISARNGYIEVSVAETEFYNKPIYSKKVGPKQIWIRQGSTNVRASDEEMRSLFAGAAGGGENQLVTGDPIELIDENKVAEYISKTGLNPIKIEDTKAKLYKIKAQNDQGLTIFGLIAFGKTDKIDEKLNNVYIDFRVFPGASKVLPDNPEVIYSDRKEFHGDVKTQFSLAFEYIKTKLPTEAVLNSNTGLRENRYIIPEEAIREALANAIAHRDYLIQSSCINIDLFSDRIELSNPGESLVAIKDLEKASSKSRNPNLMEFLKACNITDKTARGIPTIYQAARNRGLLDPKFENISGCFKATLFFSSPHSGGDRVWVENISKKFRLRDTQKNALVYIKNTGSISNKQYCEINHMNERNDDRRARRELSELVNNNLISVIGVGPGTKYVLSGHYPDKATSVK